jgi:hypothetical protein
MRWLRGPRNSTALVTMNAPYGVVVDAARQTPHCPREAGMFAIRFGIGSHVLPSSSRPARFLAALRPSWMTVGERLRIVGRTFISKLL